MQTMNAYGTAAQQSATMTADGGNASMLQLMGPASNLQPDVQASGLYSPAVGNYPSVQSGLQQSLADVGGATAHHVQNQPLGQQNDAHSLQQLGSPGRQQQQQLTSLPVTLPAQSKTQQQRQQQPLQLVGVDGDQRGAPAISTKTKEDDISIAAYKQWSNNYEAQLVSKASLHEAPDLELCMAIYMEVHACDMFVCTLYPMNWSQALCPAVAVGRNANLIVQSGVFAVICLHLLYSECATCETFQTASLMQGSAAAEQPGSAEVAPQPNSESAIVTWDAFKTLARPGDRLRLVGDALPVPDNALPASEAAMHPVANTLTGAQQSHQHGNISPDVALSSLQGIVMPAGSSMPLVTDAEAAKSVVGMPAGSSMPLLTDGDVGKWVVGMPAGTSSLSGNHAYVKQGQFSAPLGDMRDVGEDHHAPAMNSGDQAGVDFGADDTDGLTAASSQADRLMMLAQVH